MTDAVLEHNESLLRDNAELRSIADELRTRTDELNVVALFLQSVLTSISGAVVVMDDAGGIRVWNAEAERLWGIPRRVAMRSDFSDLDLGFPKSCLDQPIAAGLRGEVSAAVPIDVTTASGRLDPRMVSVTPLLGPGATVHGATLLFVERSR